MSNSFGMPGPGGSLGQCAVCGKPFLAEILLGKTVEEFRVGGSNQRLFGHKTCIKQIQTMETFYELPDGPLKQAFLAQKEAAKDDGGAL